MKMKSEWEKNKGFTLIELIVVMAIIGVLAGMIMVNFIGVRQRSRDDVRKSDLHQMQAALELYRSDVGLYPTNGQFTWNGSSQQCGDNVKMTSPDGSIVYMQKVPCDPLSNNAYTYDSPDDGITYTIVACLENKNDAQQDKNSDGSPNVAPQCQTSAFGASYTISNP